LNLILKAENLSYWVDTRNGEKVILKDISFDLQRNRVTGISGESGSGKTTLSKIIAGILKPSSGRINYYFGKKYKKISPVQILFQNTGEIINPLREVSDVLNEALNIGNKNNSSVIQLESLIDNVKLPEQLLKRKGYELSGGEQQRVALARVLAVKPELIILDEPFSAQDYESQENFLNLFLDLKKNLDITMVCIAHNLRLLQKLSDDMIIMYNGEIVERNDSNDLFRNPKHNYTSFLLKAERYDLEYKEIEKNLKSIPLQRKGVDKSSL
jgi:ABC-type dipeptide/oligopeptide/nickel transport system ATPase subunit